MSELFSDPDMVADWRPKIANSSDAYIAGALCGWVKRAARDHGRQCSGCDTCNDFVWALSLVDAVAIEHIADPDTINRLRLPDE